MNNLNTIPRQEICFADFDTEVESNIEVHHLALETVINNFESVFGAPPVYMVLGEKLLYVVEFMMRRKLNSFPNIIRVPGLKHGIEATTVLLTKHNPFVDEEKDNGHSG